MPLLLSAVPVILLARPLAWGATLGALALLFAGMEAFARRGLLSFMASTAMVLAAVAALVALIELAQQYWKVTLSAVFAAAAFLLLVGNVGDLTHGWRRSVSLSEEDRDQVPRDDAESP
jgi:predicted lysophospholipase L1 biosynthesis ABC-type transport system permease subunit